MQIEIRQGKLTRSTKISGGSIVVSTRRGFSFRQEVSANQRVSLFPSEEAIDPGTGEILTPREYR